MKNNELKEEKKTIENVINNSIGWAKNKDIELLYKTFADDEDFLEVHPEDSVTKGITEFKKMEKFWLDDNFQAVGFEIKDLRIKISQSGTVAWFFCRLDDMNQWKGKPINWMNARWTGVLEKRSGNWWIVQQHFSYAD